MNNQSQEENEEILDFTKPSFVFKAKDHHEFRQQGTYLVCKSCDVTHAVWIGIERILTGFDKEGQPIIKKRKEVMGA